MSPELKRVASQTQVSDVGLVLIRSLREARDAVKEWADEESKRKVALVEWMGDADEVYDGPDRLVHGYTVSRERIDEKRLKERYPDVYQDCLRPAPYYRLDIKLPA